MTTTRAAVAATLIAASLSLAPLAGANAADDVPAQTRVISDCTHYRVEPGRLVGACADGNEYAVVKHYSSWGEERAVGRGRLVVNDCTPNCAAGEMRRYPARFVIDRPVGTDHGRVFTRLKVSFVRDGEREHAVIDLPRRPVDA